MTSWPLLGRSSGFEASKRPISATSSGGTFGASCWIGVYWPDRIFRTISLGSAPENGMYPVHRR